jgi:hypothetical protein
MAAFTHAPAGQLSVVHGFPSLQSALTAHGVHPGTVVWVQPEAALHASVVHALPSSQFGAVPTWHAPAWHVSAPLHTVASAQDVPFATAV